MCGRFVQIITLEKLEQRFGIKVPDGTVIEPLINIAPGDYAYVITHRKTAEIRKFRFGLQPSWANKPMYLFNARSEGDLNPDNMPDYAGVKGIFQKPAFQKPIRSQRCLVLASAFIEGTYQHGLDEPYLIKMTDNDPFAMAGIWDVWKDKNTGEELHSFAIITSVANELLLKLPHQRSPVVLDRSDESKWLDPSLPLADVLKLLKPFPGENMIAEPISIKVRNPRNKDADLIIPVGNAITSHSDIQIRKETRLKGMGTSKRKGDPPNWQGTLF